jgi:glycosyltransferase involved in cell wall biosynthesis
VAHRVLFLADQFADSPRDSISKYPGGAELTDDAVIRASPWPVERVRIQDFKPSWLLDFNVLLLGNLRLATAEQRGAIAERRRHVLFEHDYRMCRWRGDFAVSMSPYHRQLWRCDCLQRRWGAIFRTALGAVFLTHRQLAVYRSNPFVKLPRHAVLGCSVMNPEFFEMVARQRRRSEARSGTCVVYSGHATKGYKQALAYCKEHGINPQIIRDATPAEVLQTFASAERLVFLPQWPEPASRVAVEARFLGCQIVSNDALGVAGESWWHAPDDLALEFVQEAPRRFWALVESFLGGPASANHAWKRPNREPRIVSGHRGTNRGERKRGARVCIDLTPNETSDRYGGIGRYGYYLLEQLLKLPAVQDGRIEVVALPVSNEPVMPARQALERAVLDRPPVDFEQHRRNRHLFAGLELRDAQVDLFHAIQPVAMPLIPGCKIVCTVHDLIPIVCPPSDKSRYAEQYRRLREKLEWGTRILRAHHIIAISDWTAQDLVQLLRVARSKMTTVYHGVDTRLFNTDRTEDADVLRKYDLPARGFLCVSSDHYRKNHRLLFDAWCEQADRIPESLVFVGRAIYGSTLQDIRNEVERRGLASRFRWLSDVPDEELPAIYRWARATVAPSLYEGFGMTLIESMACGTPVAVARNGVYEEVGGSAVIQFNGRSESDLGRALLDLSRDAALHERLVTEGLKRAQRFTWKRTAEATLGVYTRILSSAKNVAYAPRTLG